MNPEQFIVNLNDIVTFVRTEVSNKALIDGAFTMGKDINKRVEMTGIDSDGRSFGGYSTKTTLVGRSSFTTQGAFDKLFKIEKFTNAFGISGEVSRSLKKSKGAKTFRRWATIKSGGHWVHLIILEGGYKMIRNLEGRQTSFKSFSRRRVMWSNFGVKRSAKGIAVLGGKKEEAQKLINVNSWRERNNIIRPSQAEIDKLGLYISNKIAEKMKNKLR